MLRRVINTISFRLKMARFGIFYARSKSFSLRSARVAGKRIHFSFPAGEEKVQGHELGKILFQDCYHLGEVPAGIHTVLDIGANIGLFAVAARHFFPHAVIHSYEPNPSLEKHLQAHCMPLRIKYHMEAVGAEPGRISMQRQENSLHTVVQKNADGGIAQIAFTQGVERLGGTVDLLKLDCEGAEWSLFDDTGSWERVRHLTMEYHLWARPGATLDDLRRRLDALGFDCVRVEPSAEGSFGMLQAKNRRIV